MVEDRTNSCKMFSDLHTHAHTQISKCNKIFQNLLLSEGGMTEEVW